MMTVFLSASKVSILTGNNRFESVRDFIQNLWMKYNYDDYIKIINKLKKKRQKGLDNEIVKENITKKLKEKNINILIKNMTKKEIIKTISKNNDLTKNDKIIIKNELNEMHNINEKKEEYKKPANKIVSDLEIVKNANLHNDINKFSKTTKELDDNKKKIIKKINEMKITNKKKELIKKSVIGVSNKKYGTNREKITVEHFQNKYNMKVIINKKYYRKVFYKVNNINFSFIGEIDGMLENGNILEIKNRTRRLFHRVYNYEKDQMYIYMYLLNKQKCVLAEHYNNEINDMCIVFDNNYMDKLLKHLKIFAHYYDELINNVDMQKELLLYSDKDFKNMYSLRTI